MITQVRLTSIFTLWRAVLSNDPTGQLTSFRTERTSSWLCRLVVRNPIWRRWLWIALLSNQVHAQNNNSVEFDKLYQQYLSGDMSFFTDESVKNYRDQLKALLPPHDADRLLKYQRLACYIDYFDAPQDGKTAAKQYFASINAQQEPAAAADFLACEAYHADVTGEITTAMQLLQQALPYAKAAEDALLQADIMGQIASIHSMQGNHAESLILLLQNNDIYQRSKHNAGLALTVQDIATTYRRMGDNAKAIEYLELSETQYLHPDDDMGQAFIWQQKAYAYTDLADIAQARRYFDKARAVYEKKQLSDFILANDIDQMWLDNLEQQHGKSLARGLAIERQLQQRQAKEPQSKLSNQDLFLLQFAEAQAFAGEMALAQSLYVQAEQQFTASENKRYLLWLYRSWSKASAHHQQFERAYQLLNKAEHLAATIQSSSRQQREVLLRFQFDTELQTERNRKLKEANRLSEQQVKTLEQAEVWQRIAIGLFVLLSVIALTYAVNQIRRNRQLHQLAMTDELTQVDNRRSILAHAQQQRLRLLQHNVPLTLLLLDIDHFKYFNDQFGHEAGDQVLMDVVQGIKSQLRSQDLIGRTGGEEFLVLLADTALVEAMTIAEQIRVAVEQLPIHGLAQSRVTVSIGVSQLHRHDEIREAMARADYALYQAKAQGRNQVCQA